MTKVTRAQPLRKAEAAAAVEKQAPPSPPPRATDTLMAQIAQRQAAEPGLSVVAALDAVQKQAPELYAEYMADARIPHLQGQPLPVAKADPLTYEQILKMATAQRLPRARRPGRC